MKKILIDGMTGNAGGLESFIMNLVRNLDKTRYSFDFAVTDNPVAYEDELQKIGKIRRITPRYQNPKQNRQDAFALFETESYDALWFNKTTLSNIEILKAAKKYDVPIRICHSHAAKNLGSALTLVLHRINRKKAIRFSTHLIACSPAAAEWFYKKDANQAMILKNAIELGKYRYTSEKASKIKQSLNIEGRFTVGHVGMLSAIKNQTFLLDIFSEIQKKEPNSVLLLCGDGKLRDELQTKAAMLGISEKVRFLGIRNDIPEILSAMDVMIFPSLHEGAPFALIEAQAAGLPCLVSDTVNAEAIAEGLLHPLSLSLPAGIWADRALALREEKTDREPYAEAMKNSGYSIETLIREAEQILS